MAMPGPGQPGSAELATVGSRVPADPTARRSAVHVFGAARRLTLRDYLSTVHPLRALAADPAVDLAVVVGGERDDAAAVAATLVACGLGSAAFWHHPAGDPLPGAGWVLDDVVDLPAGIEVMDLRESRTPMGEVPDNSRGVVHLLDDPSHLAAAVRGARVDLDPALGYDPELRPGVANLARILGGLTGRSPVAALIGLHGASELKRAVTAALVETLHPVQDRYRELAGDPQTLHRLLR